MIAAIFNNLQKILHRAQILGVIQFMSFLKVLKFHLPEPLMQFEFFEKLTQTELKTVRLPRKIPQKPKFHQSAKKIKLNQQAIVKVRGLVVSVLDFRSGGRLIESSFRRRCVVSLDKKLYSTLSLFTQGYKWVPAIIMLG